MGHGKNPQQKCPYSIILTINRENILHYDDTCKSLITSNGIRYIIGKGYFAHICSDFTCCHLFRR